MTAAVAMGLFLVFAGAVGIHINRYRAKVGLLRSLQGTQVVLGIATTGTPRVVRVVAARIDEVSEGFPPMCRLTPFAMQRGRHEWESVATFTADELAGGILVDRIAWLETQDGTRHDF